MYNNDAQDMETQPYNMSLRNTYQKLISYMIYFTAFDDNHSLLLSLNTLNYKKK